LSFNIQFYQTYLEHVINQAFGRLL